MKRLKQQEFEVLIEVLIQTKGNPSVKRQLPRNLQTLRIPVS